MADADASDDGTTTQPTSSGTSSSTTTSTVESSSSADETTTAAAISTEWSAIAVGENHGCGIDGMARLFCWGSNADGQLGLAEEGVRGPTEITTPGASWISVAGGRAAADAGGLAHRLGERRRLRRPQLRRRSRRQNYVAVIIELAVVPLLFGAYGTAIVASLVNAALLFGVRIPCETAALRSATAARP